MYAIKPTYLFQLQFSLVVALFLNGCAVSGVSRDLDAARNKESLTQEKAGQSYRLITPHPFLSLVYTGQDKEIAQSTAKIATEAMAMAERWGKLQAPAEIIILPSHEALEKAAYRRNYPWLRAWTRYDEVLLQSPKTWANKDVEVQLKELLTHELTHLVMYQNIGTEKTWSEVEIPLWYREGMASVNAGQEHLRMNRNEIAERLRASPDLFPLRDGDKLFQTEKDLTYSCAHYAFKYLLETYGEAWIPKLHSLIKLNGYTFDEAFLKSLGISHSDFVTKYHQYLSGAVSSITLEST